MNNFRYHHTGIPTTNPQEGERYSPTFKMHTNPTIRLMVIG